MHGPPRWDPKRGNGGSLTASRWGGKGKWGKLGCTLAVGCEGAPVKPVVCLAGYYALRNCTGGGRSLHLGASQLLKNPHPRAAESPSSLLLTCLKNGDCAQMCSMLTSTCTGPTYAPNEIFFSCTQGQTLPLRCPGSGGITLPSAESGFPEVRLG